jgi:hypothetical protein
LKINVPYLVIIKKQANWATLYAGWRRKVQDRGLILAVGDFELARQEEPKIDAIEHS